jgi:hypothetical protein
MLGCELKSFARFNNVLGVFYRRWPIKTLPERLSR